MDAESKPYSGKGNMGQAISDFKRGHAQGLTQQWPLYWREFASQAFADLIAAEALISSAIEELRKPKASKKETMEYLTSAHNLLRTKK